MSLKKVVPLAMLACSSNLVAGYDQQVPPPSDAPIVNTKQEDTVIEESYVETKEDILD